MSHFPYRVLRHGLFGTAAASTLLAATNMVQRYRDSVQGEDGFSQHTRKEHKANLISGMHGPLMPNCEQHAIFMGDFPQYSHLLPTTLDAFRRQQALATPVKIRALPDCPTVLNYANSGTLVVGGAPALMSAAASLTNRR